MSARLKDWEKLMDAAITARLGQTFQRGVTDCIMTVADIVLAYTAVDFAADYRGRYADDLGAFRIITEGGGDLGKMLSGRMESIGWREINPNFAHRGDVAFVYRGKLDQALGIFTGAGILTPDKVGLKTIPRAEALRAWRIG